MNLLPCLIKAKAGMIRNNTKVNLGKQTAIIFYHQERTYQENQKDICHTSLTGTIYGKLFEAFRSTCIYNMKTTDNKKIKT